MDVIRHLCLLIMIWLTFITLAGMEAVTTLSFVLNDWVDKLVSRITPFQKASVLNSRKATSGSRMIWVQEI